MTMTKLKTDDFKDWARGHCLKLGMLVSFGAMNKVILAGGDRKVIGEGNTMGAAIHSVAAQVSGGKFSINGDIVDVPVFVEEVEA